MTSLQLSLFVGAGVLALLAIGVYDMLRSKALGQSLINEAIAAPSKVQRLWIDKAGGSTRLNLLTSNHPLRTVPVVFQIEGVMNALRAAGLQPLDLRYPSSRR